MQNIYFMYGGTSMIVGFFMLVLSLALAKGYPGNLMSNIVIIGVLLILGGLTSIIVYASPSIVHMLSIVLEIPKSSFSGYVDVMKATVVIYWLMYLHFLFTTFSKRMKTVKAK